MEERTDVWPALRIECMLGEGAVWDARRNLLWFVDIKRHYLWRFDPKSGESDCFGAPGQIGWALPAENGFLLCGIDLKLYSFDPHTAQFEKLIAIEGEPRTNRVNDACTDPFGRVWFGTMDNDETDPTGRFHVFERGRISQAGPCGIIIPNGPAVNAEGTRIYFNDTANKRIMVADMNATGIGEPRIFVGPSQDFPPGHPDGPVVDAEGYVWSAFYGGGCVARFSPEGKLVTKIPIPARDVTKMAFGGKDFGTAFITSATKDMEPEQRRNYPLAGSLFAFESAVRGFAQTPAKLS